MSLSSILEVVGTSLIGITLFELLPIAPPEICIQCYAKHSERHNQKKKSLRFLGISTLMKPFRQLDQGYARNYGHEPVYSP